MHESDVRSDVGQVQRLFHRRVAAADHGNRLAAVEEAVAGGAGGNTLAAEDLFRGKSQIFGRRAGRDDEGIAGVLAAVAEQAKGALPQLGPVDRVEYDFRVEALRMA